MYFYFVASILYNILLPIGNSMEIRDPAVSWHHNESEMFGKRNKDLGQRLGKPACHAMQIADRPAMSPDVEHGLASPIAHRVHRSSIFVYR